MNSSSDNFEQAKKYFLLGLESYEKELFFDAEKFFLLSLHFWPDRLSTLTNLSSVLIKLEKLEKANEIISKAMKLSSMDKVLHINQGHLFGKSKNWQMSLACYEKAIDIEPNYAEGYFSRGNAFLELGRLEDAIVSYEQAISISPSYLEAHINRGNAFLALKRPEQALTSYDEAIKIKPNYAMGYHHRGAALQELGRLEAAVESYDQSIAINPSYEDAYANLGNALLALNRPEQALISYEKSISLRPDNAEAYSNRGNALLDLKRVEDALASYEKALEIKPDYAAGHYNHGNALQELNRLEEAVASYDRAISIHLAFEEAFANRGNALLALKRPEHALASYAQAISINPNCAEFHYNHGRAQQELGRLKEALVSYDKAVILNPDYAAGYYNRGITLQALGRLDEAVLSYERTLALDPDYEYLQGIYLHIKMLMCDWENFEYNIESLLLNINQRKRASTCFPILALTDSLPIQRKASEVLVNDKYPLNTSLGPILKSNTCRKIKIGYYSAHFRDHPVSILCAELFETHDRNKFELFGFYSGPPDFSKMHQRVASAFDVFADVWLKDDREIAILSRDIGIDIAVDLTGLTENSRVGVFSYRAAPIQISYIGYLGTMGAQYYDYLIADKTIIPAGSQQYYSEKIVYLPSYQVNDSKREIADKLYTKSELNLPEKSFVFCCFNNNYKLTPTTFDSWMRILAAVPDSILLIYVGNKWAQANIKMEAEKRGIVQNRIVFGSRIGASENLARYRSADLFLDTLPYNAGTTASDAIWSGLPVLTCMGESFASRVAASLLNAIELPELITTTREEYEAKAIELATNPTKIKAIKEKLECNRKTTALFDTQRFTGHIETAYSEMYRRYKADLPLDHIYI